MAEDMDVPSAKQIQQIAEGLATGYLILVSHGIINAPMPWSLVDRARLIKGFNEALTEFVSHVAKDS